jgi:phenylacetate-CoA ligase
VERQIVYRRQDLASFSADGLDQPVNVLDQYLQDIDRFRPHILKGLPAYLYLLAMRIQDGGPRPRLGATVMPMGSSITPHMKRTVESAFGRPVHEDYGCAEAGAMAAECSFRNGLHPFEELFHIEILRNGRPVRDGEVGKIYITDLSNYAMPLIRYEIGDVGTVRRGPCACGLTGDRLEVHGRVHDCVVADDGSILTQDALVDSIFSLPGVLGFQLEERPDGEFQVRVVPRGTHSANLDDVKNVLAELAGPSRRIVTRQVRTLVPERGGKYRFVKNHTDAPSRVLN